MGKKRAGKDRGYQTATEWREEGGGHRGRLHGAATVFKRLPFSCCAISFQPFEDPVCTADGTVFDIVNVVPYIQKFKRHPVTGEPLELKDLVRLHFHKNGEGEYVCPVLGKVFNENSHIVAVRPSGNVYCWEAVEQLCLKPKNMRDLLTDEPFTRKDVIQLQDPLNLAGKNLAAFDHVVKALSVEDEAARAAREADPMFGIRNVNEDARRALAALGSTEAEAAFAAGGGGKKAQAERVLAEAKAAAAAAAAGRSSTTTTTSAAGAAGRASVPGQPDPRLRSAPATAAATSFKPGASTWNTDEPAAAGAAGTAGAAGKVDPSAGRPLPPPYSQRYVASHATTGAASRSFTSTSQAVATKNERTMELQELKPTKKGYLRMHTSLGDLNLELHADIAPKACENFLALAAGGYYTGTSFHRSIKNFMIQGGDPTGSGKGGESVFGGPFRDEVDSRLLHSGRGVLAMANSGPSSNGSQFYLLYKSAHHLDYKHTVFGKVVGGFETLTAMERVPTDPDDRPLQPITIQGVEVFVNPYTDLLEEEARREAAAKKKEEAPAVRLEELGGWFSEPASTTAGTAGGGGVGKYLQLPSSSSARSAAAATATAAAAASGPAPKKQKTTKAVELSDFDAW